MTSRSRRRQKVSLQHLCIEDKQRVHQLIVELAIAEQEKATAKIELGRERGRFKHALIQLNHQMVLLEREKNKLQSQVCGFQSENEHLSHPKMCVTTHHPSLQYHTTHDPLPLAVKTPVNMADAVCPQASTPFQLSADTSPQIQYFCSPQTLEPTIILDASNCVHDSNTALVDVAHQPSFEVAPNGICQHLECLSPCIEDTAHLHCHSSDLSIKSWFTPPSSSQEQRETLKDTGVYTVTGADTHSSNIQEMPKQLSDVVSLEGINVHFSSNEDFPYSTQRHLTAAAYINVDTNSDACKKNTTTESAAGVEGDRHATDDVELATELLNAHTWECSKCWSSVLVLEKE
jgi:hypothetical protein